MAGSRTRSRLIGLCLFFASAAASFAAFEIVGGALLRRTLGEDNVADVDHRLKPNARRGINADGIRNPHGPEHYGDDSWNVVFLGDSYTYGVYVKAEHAFPALVGRLLDEASLPRPVKVANFGWASSSPLLSLRLLRDIGARYRPDLVVLCLDMTDFHDDLRYSRLLAASETRLSPSRFLLRRSGLDRPLARAQERLGLRGPAEPPAERFFSARQPLHESRPFLRETEQNIHAISDAAAELGAVAEELSLAAIAARLRELLVTPADALWRKSPSAGRRSRACTLEWSRAARDPAVPAPAGGQRPHSGDEWRKNASACAASGPSAVPRAPDTA